MAAILSSTTVNSMTLRTWPPGAQASAARPFARTRRAPQRPRSELRRPPRLPVSGAATPWPAPPGQVRTRHRDGEDAPGLRSLPPAPLEERPRREPDGAPGRRSRRPVYLVPDAGPGWPVAWRPGGNARRLRRSCRTARRTRRAGRTQPARRASGNSAPPAARHPPTPPGGPTPQDRSHCGVLGVWNIESRGVLRTGATRPQAVEADPSGHGGEPPGHVLDRVPIGTHDLEPRLLDSVLGLDAGSEHPIGHAFQTRAVGLELPRNPLGSSIAQPRLAGPTQSRSSMGPIMACA